MHCGMQVQQVTQHIAVGLPMFLLPCKPHISPAEEPVHHGDHPSTYDA